MIWYSSNSCIYNFLWFTISLIRPICMYKTYRYTLLMLLLNLLWGLVSLILFVSDNSRESRNHGCKILLGSRWVDRINTIIIFSFFIIGFGRKGPLGPLPMPWIHFFISLVDRTSIYILWSSNDDPIYLNLYQGAQEVLSILGWG